MAGIQFSRIQIACDGFIQAITDYSILLDVQPIWQGSIVDPERFGAVQVPAAWFDVNNLIVELLDNSVIKQRPSICGLVLYAASLTPFELALSHSRCEFLTDGFAVREETLSYINDNRGINVAITTAMPASVPKLEYDNFRADHLVLRSSDANACIELFGRQLGMRLALEVYKPEWGGHMLFFRTGKMTLEVIVPVEGVTNGDYFWGLALQNKNLEAVRKRLLNTGVIIGEIREGRKQGTKVASLKSHNAGVPTLLILSE